MESRKKQLEKDPRGAINPRRPKKKRRADSAKVKTEQERKETNEASHEASRLLVSLSLASFAAPINPELDLHHS